MQDIFNYIFRWQRGWIAYLVSSETKQVAVDSINIGFLDVFFIILAPILFYISIKTLMGDNEYCQGLALIGAVISVFLGLGTLPSFIMCFVIYLVYAAVKHILYLVLENKYKFNKSDFLKAQSFENKIKLSYNQFINFYYLNPERYSLRECYVFTKNPHTNIIFSFLDSIKYQRFTCSKNKIETNKKKTKAEFDLLEEYLHSVREDITATKNKADVMFHKSENFIKNIKINRGGE